MFRSKTLELTEKKGRGTESSLFSLDVFQVWASLSRTYSSSNSSRAVSNSSRVRRCSSNRLCLCWELELRAADPWCLGLSFRAARWAEGGPSLGPCPSRPCPSNSGPRIRNNNSGPICKRWVCHCLFSHKVAAVPTKMCFLLSLYKGNNFTS